MNRLQPESSIWTEPRQSSSLGDCEVHVWRIELDQPADVLDKFRSVLEAEEIDRSNRFHFEQHQQHFVVSRGFLRHVVARYLGARPEALRFSYGAHGKPALERSGLRFNMSHSHSVALVAVAENKEVGVDVEHIRADFATEDIAQRFFSRGEVETLNALPAEEQVAAFFRCWTRKEAYIKAIGRGLSQPLHSFDVTLAPGERARLLRADEDDTSRWYLSDLEVGQNYAAALAVEAPISHICFWQPQIDTD